MFVNYEIAKIIFLPNIQLALIVASVQRRIRKFKKRSKEKLQFFPKSRALEEKNKSSTCLRLGVLTRSRLETLQCRTHIMDAYKHGHHAIRVNVSTSCCSGTVEVVPSPYAAADEAQVYGAWSSA